jgi:hypothetical protein
LIEEINAEGGVLNEKKLKLARIDVNGFAR